MRLTLRGLIVATLLGALALLAGCSADSPTPTSNGGGPGGNSALAISLTTTNPSPKAGTCTVVQAFATLSGAAVPDGTSIVLSTSFGVFAQNGLQTISLVTQSGAAAATVCSDSEGTVTVKGTVTLANKTAQRSLILQFTNNGLPPPGTPFISICANPHNGGINGGQIVDITGGGFGTNPAAVRVFFRSGAIVHQAVVTNVTDSDITVLTPAFPELTGLGATSVDVQVVLGVGTVLDSPNCFTYVASSAFVSICANPGTGPLNGGTQVTIQGGGFGIVPQAVQVFFRIGSTTLPGVVTAVTDSQITVITPAFTGLNPTVANVADIIVKIGASTTITSPNCFTFTSVSIPPAVSSILPTSGTKLGGTRVTILGSGFSSPVQVFFGSVQAEVVSVNFSQIIAITPPLQGGAAPGPVQVTVKNAACSGTCVSNGVTYTFTVPLSIVSFSPVQGDASTVVTIFGEGFVAPLQVLFGSQEGTVVSVTGTQILVRPPAGCGAGGTITVTLIATGESATSSASFTGVGPTLNSTNGLVPSSGPSGSTTAAVVNGTNLFDSGNAHPSIFNPQGGTVSITGTSELNGGQSINVNITPNGSASTVTFAIRNDNTGCVSGTVSFTVTNAPQITAALTPNTGPIGSCTTATVTGTGLFPTGVTSGVQIVNVTGPGTVSIVTAVDGSPQTLTLSICPTAAGVITFQIKNTGTGLTSSALTFTASCGTTASAPTPSSGPSGQPTTATVTGTGLFPTGNPGAASIVNIVGGTVIISGTTDGSSQSLTLTITPNVAGCNSTIVTFAVKNTVSGCTSGTISFTGTSGVTAGAPNPASGPAGTTTISTVTGTGFFPTGNSSAVNICNAAGANCGTTGVVATGGTITLSGAAEGSGTQTLTLQITPTAGCTTGSVSFTIKNTTSGCLSSPISFQSIGTQPTVTSGPTPSNGPATATTQVTVTGTNLFPAGNPAAANIVGASGGSVTIINAQDNTPSAGVQTLTINITPTNCSSLKVTFAINNGSCTTPTLNFIVNGLTITSGPTPPTAPASGTTSVTVVGSGFFPSSNPGAVQICTPNGATCGTTAVAITNGSATITNAQNNVPSAGLQTVTIGLTPSASIACTGGSMSFAIKDTVDGCLSSTLSVIVSGGPIVISGPTPAAGAPTSTSTVTVVGSGFFPAGLPNDAKLVNVVNGSLSGCAGPALSVCGVSIVNAQDNSPSTGQQTLTIQITPQNCGVTSVTFALTNTALSGSCATTHTLNFNVNGLHINSGPTPSFVIGGTLSTVQFTGVGFFPVGIPAQLVLDGVSSPAGAVGISGAVDNGDGTQTVTLTIDTFHVNSGAGDCNTPVTFNLKNGATGCSTMNPPFSPAGLSVLVDKPPLPSATITQSPGAAGTFHVDFSSSPTPAGTNLMCTWTFTGDSPTPASVGPVQCGNGTSVSVQFGATGNSNAQLTVVDVCGQSFTTNAPVSVP